MTRAPGLGKIYDNVFILKDYVSDLASLGDRTQIREKEPKPVQSDFVSAPFKKSDSEY